MRVPEPVAAVRRAVREALALTQRTGEFAASTRTNSAFAADRGPDRRVLRRRGLAGAGRRGGARRRRAGRPVHGVVVDHGLQDGSAEQAAGDRGSSRRAGARVAPRSSPSRSGRRAGPEAAARDARYAALRARVGRGTAARRCCSVTRSTTRPRPCCSASGAGSGRALARRHGRAGTRRGAVRCSGCGARRHGRRAPRRASPRGTTPTTTTRRFTRVRLRHEVLPLLEDVLAGGVAPALARTAAQLADDDAAPRGPRRRPGGARSSTATGPSTRAAWPPTRPRCGAGCCGAGWARPGSRSSPTPTCAPSTTSSRAWRGQGAPPLPGGLEVVRAAWQAAGARGDHRRRPQRHHPVRSSQTVYDGDIASVLITEEQIQDKIADARRAHRDGPPRRRRARARPRARRRAQGRRDVHDRPGARAPDADPARVHGRELLRVVDLVLGRRAHPQGPRPRHLRAPRPDRRGHHRLRADAVVAAQEPGVARAGVAARS